MVLRFACFVRSCAGPRASAVVWSCCLALLPGCSGDRPSVGDVHPIDAAAAHPSSGDLPIAIGQEGRDTLLDASSASLDARIEELDAGHHIDRRGRDGGRCSGACAPVEPLQLSVMSSIDELTRCEIEACRDAECLRGGLNGLADALRKPSITLSFQSQLDDGGYLAVWLELREDSEGQLRLVFAWEPDAFDALPTDGSSYSVRLIDRTGRTLATIERKR
jgi:hypothetical protein